MVIDCFPLLKELDMLEIRLHEHSFVDKFIITEASTDYAGHPKPYYLQDNWHRFKTFWEKIWYLKIDLTFIEGTLSREIYQRDHPVKWFENFIPNSIIINTDIDEIINRDQFDRYNAEMGAVNPEMKLSVYYLNTVTGATWKHGTISRVQDVTKGLHELRYRKGLKLLPNMGRHFSWCGGAEFIRAKYLSQIGGENWPIKLKDDKKVTELLEGLTAWWDGKKLKKVPIDETFPEIIREHPERFKHLIYDK